MKIAIIVTLFLAGCGGFSDCWTAFNRLANCTGCDGWADQWYIDQCEAIPSLAGWAAEYARCEVDSETCECKQGE